MVYRHCRLSSSGASPRDFRDAVKSDPISLVSMSGLRVVDNKLGMMVGQRTKNKMERAIKVISFPVHLLHPVELPYWQAVCWLEFRLLMRP